MYRDFACDQFHSTKLTANPKRTGFSQIEGNVERQRNHLIEHASVNHEYGDHIGVQQALALCDETVLQQ